MTAYCQQLTTAASPVVVAVHSAGEKLSESRASDIRELCNTLLSAYLIQLLDTGLLHADPHPGNLIRTGAHQQGAQGGHCRQVHLAVAWLKRPCFLFWGTAVTGWCRR